MRTPTVAQRGVTRRVTVHAVRADTKTTGRTQHVQPPWGTPCIPLRNNQTQLRGAGVEVFATSLSARTHPLDGCGSDDALPPPHAAMRRLHRARTHISTECQPDLSAAADTVPRPTHTAPVSLTVQAQSLLIPSDARSPPRRPADHLPCARVAEPSPSSSQPPSSTPQ